MSKIITKNVKNVKRVFLKKKIKEIVEKSPLKDCAVFFFGKNILNI